MNYWDILAEAEALLARGEFAAAELRFHEARRVRDDSPGRVFLSEKMADAVRGAWSRLRGAPSGADGRWEAAAGAFREHYLVAGAEAVARAGEMLAASAEVSGEHLSLCASVLHLVSRSRIYPSDARQVPALVLAVLTASLASSAAPPAGILDGDLPLDEPDRVAAARLGTRLVDGLRSAGAEQAVIRDLAESLLEMLAPTRFSLHSPLEEERSWREAVLTDRGLGDGIRAAGLYRHFLAVGPQQSRRDEARVRLLEILANIDRFHVAVPRYDEAVGAAGAERPPDAALAERYDRGLAIVAARLQAPGRSWASCAREGDAWTVVCWRGDDPVDVVTWLPGQDQESVRAFLASCRGVVLAAGGSESPDPLRGAPLFPVAEALLEPWLPAAGLTADAVADLIRGCAGGEKRASHPAWDRDEAVPGTPLDIALRAGRLWRVCLRRVRRAGPVFLAGVEMLAAAADPVATTLVMALDRAADTDAAAAWPEPLPLAGRPSPRLGAVDRDPPPALSEEDRQVLRDDAILVSGGDAAAVLAAWSEERPRVRIVLDHAGRLGAAAAALAGSDGPVTILPRGGVPHDLERALALLRTLTPAPEGAWDPLVLFHWIRICESHNGDLLDFLAVRPRPAAAVGICDRYREVVAALPAAGEGTRWMCELEERAAASRVVAGTADDLDGATADLGRRWGASAAGAAAWAFCGSAGIHWRLVRRSRGAGADLHRRLAPLSCAHLSLLPATPFLGERLAGLLAGWLPAGTTARRLVLPGGDRSQLRLAGRGIDVDAEIARGDAFAGCLEFFETADAGNGAVLVAPAGGPLRVFIEAQARHEKEQGLRGRLLVPDDLWDAPAAAAVSRLMIARLESLDVVAPAPEQPDPEAWREADRLRAEALDGSFDLCALEVGALLEIGAAAVDVLDTRWARRLPASVPDGPVAAVRRGGIELLELPAGSRDRRRKKRASGSLAAACLDWCRDERICDDRGEGLLPGTAASAPKIPGDIPRAGSLILAGEQREALLHQLLRDLVRRRESGETTAWMLFVGARPPAVAAAVARALPFAAPSVPPRSPAGGPVYWVRPGDLADAGTRRVLTENPPTAVHAVDLRDWLPPAADPATAAALRFLVRDLRCTVLVGASSLPAAWDRFCRTLWETAADRPHLLPAARDDGSDRGDGGLPPVSAGRIGHPRILCPRCGTEFPLKRAGMSCPSCSLAAGRWLAPSARARLRADLLDLKVRALLDRSDLGAGAPLVIWTEALRVGALGKVLSEHGISARRSEDRLRIDPGDGRCWELAVLGTGVAPRPGCRHALLDLPEDESDLQAFRRAAGGEVGLWYHPLEVSASHRPPACGPASVRYARLLGGMVEPAGLDAAWRWEGILPARLMALLTGMQPGTVRRAMSVAEWAAEVAGFARDGDLDPGPRRLEPRLTYTELDFRAGRLRNALKRLLPVLLNGLRPGAITVLDIDSLPLALEWDDLALCDRFLAASSLRLGDSGAGDPQPDRDAAAVGVELLYVPDQGMLFSPRRRIGCLGVVPRVVEALDARLDRFLAGAAGIFDSRTADGLLTVPSDRDLLAMGILLGAWRLAGAPAAGEIPLPADTGWAAALREGGPLGPQLLLGDLAVAREEWGGRLRDAWSTGFLEEAPDTALPSGKDAAPRGRRSAGDEVATTTDFLTGRGFGIRVLRGPAGTGRMDTAAAALAAALGRGVPAAMVRVHVPDAATAARFHLAWRAVAPEQPPPALRIGSRHAPEGPPAEPGCLPADPARMVCLLLEAQDMPTETRFRISQRYRLGRLLATVDPILAEEAWEHLFLTTPARGDIVEFTVQRRQSRRLWSEQKGFAAVAGVELKGRALRRDKGECAAHWATNLDECLGFIEDERRGGSGALEVALAAPVADDLAYIGKAAARLGWLAVYATERDAWLLPGPLEFLACAADLAAAADAPSMLEPLLPPDERVEYRLWRSETDLDAGSFLGICYERIARTAWSAPFLADPVARARVEAIIADVGAESLERFIERPLARVWRRRAAEVAGLGAEPGPPLLVLATAGRERGPAADSLVYLCLGTEPPRRHYRVLAGATDRARILYQERSPLPGDAEGS